MTTSGAKSSEASHGMRYLCILRDTIRREMEVRVGRHLAERDNLEHYLEHLKISRHIPLHQNSFSSARDAVQQCAPIHDWFELSEFWDEIRQHFSGESGTTAYQRILLQLLVRLHGFWVFTLDDTKHTFSFIESPREKDEWRQPEDADIDVEVWPQVRIYFGTGIYYRDDRAKKNILQKALENYLLRPGEGSVGLGLRADRGVCLRDTVRDLRGAVAIEDCFIRNLSYIGLPVFLNAGTSSRQCLHELGERGRPIGHFGVFFPAPLGWHEPLGSSDVWCSHCTFSPQCDTKPICLYQRMWDLRRQVVQPLLAQNYETLSNDRYKRSVGQIAQLGEDATFQNRGVEPDERRRVFLEKLLPDLAKARPHEGPPDTEKTDSSEDGGPEDLKIEEFQAVQIWERHPAIAGLSEGTVSASEADHTWRQSLRWNYPDLFRAQLRQTTNNFELTERGETHGPWERKENGPWHALQEGFSMASRRLGDQHQIILVHSKGAELDQRNLDAARQFWKEALKAIETAQVPDQLPEFGERMHEIEPTKDTESEGKERNRQIDQVVCSLKWRRMLRSHVADCLVSRLLPKKAENGSASPHRAISDLLFCDKTSRARLQESLGNVSEDLDALAVTILGGANYRLAPDTTIKVGKDIRRLENRLKFELKSVNHTLSVILALAHIASDKTLGLLQAGKTARFRTNHSQETGWGVNHDWPIQSEAYLDSKVTDAYIDCGTETAFSIPAIWQAWWKEIGGAEAGRCPPELDLIEIRALNDDLSKLQVALKHAHGGYDEGAIHFILLDNQKAMAFHRVLAFDAEPLIERTRDIWSSGAHEGNKRSRLWRERDSSEETVAKAAGEIAKFIKQCAPCTDHSKSDSHDDPHSADGFYLVVASVAGELRIDRRTFNEETNPSGGETACSHCPKADETLRTAFRGIIESASEQGHFLGPAFGLTTHVFVPLRRSVQSGREDCDVGFMVFSGSQVEHDTIRRVDIRPAQRALAQFAADYLEYAISQELQTVDMQRSLQGFAHSLRRRGRFMRAGALAAFPKVTFPNLAESLGYFGPSRVREMLESFQRGPSPYEFIDSVAKMLDGAKALAPLESVNIDFNIMVGALTFVLANKPERPISTKDFPAAKQLASLGVWLCHIVNGAIAYERDYGKEVIFKPASNVNIPIENGPLGSWAVILEELVRNAAKYGSPEEPKTLTLDVTHDEVIVGCKNKRLKTPDLQKAQQQSTQTGLREMRRLLRVNYGAENDGWSLDQPKKESEWFHLTIRATHDYYTKRHKTHED